MSPNEVEYNAIFFKYFSFLTRLIKEKRGLYYENYLCEFVFSRLTGAYK